jgi:glycosyltransferase involved in cell wall biosynthesis
MLVANTFATDTRVRREARALAGEGYCVRVLCWDRQGRRPSTERIDECQVHNAKFGKSTVLVSSRLYFLIAAVAFQAIMFFRSVRLLGRTRTVLLHAHDFNTLLGCAAVKQLFKTRVSLVYDCHELTPGVYQEWYGPFVSRIVGRLEVMALRWVDAIIVANEAILSYLRSKSDAPAEVIYSCPAPGEVPRVRQQEARKRLGLCGFITLFSGRVRQDYDFDMLLDAARKLRRDGLSDFKFVFTGPAEAMAQLAKTAVDEDLRSLFDFRGWVSSEDLLLYYVASDLCYAVTANIGPNSKVLTPIKLFESMACGVPVVVRDGTLAAEIARNWGCGIIVQNSLTRFSAELMRLKNNRQLLLALGNAGRKAFLAEYNWDRMQARLLHLYTGLKFTGSKP